MILRTDLAIEAEGCGKNDFSGMKREEYASAGLKVTRIDITADRAARVIGKPMGRYVTVEGLEMTETFCDVREHIELIGQELRRLLPSSEGTVLVVGLGNRDITPDALGPKCIEHIIATRHIKNELNKSAGLSSLKSVAAVAPGVLGQTGIEAAEFLAGVVSRIRPVAMVAVDALASRSLARLGTTIQLGDTGISPGGGIGSRRITLNEKTLGVPVIAAGVPTVVDAATLAWDILGKDGCEPDEERINEVMQGRSMFVTPKETDLLTERGARLLGMAINCALQPEADFDTLVSLIS